MVCRVVIFDNASFITLETAFKICSQAGFVLDFKVKDLLDIGTEPENGKQIIPVCTSI
jgi:hypothetical protein